MHILVPKHPTSIVPLFFNIDTSVGEKGQNSKQEDIMLVQFMLRTIAETAKSHSSAGEVRRLRIAKVPVTGTCDAATIDGIRAWQEGRHDDLPATIIDGRANSARDVFYVKEGEWTIADLNGIFRMLFPNIWPRLQDHPKCPIVIKNRVAQIL
jgi:hypothetical protein